MEMSEEILIGKIVNSLHGNLSNEDSRPILEQLGFTIINVDEHFYRVTLPTGWTHELLGVIVVRDESRKMRLMQEPFGGPFGLKIF